MWKLIIFIAFTATWAFTASETSPDQSETEYISYSEEEVEKSHGGCNVTISGKKSGSFYPNNATNSTTGFHCYWNITQPENITDPVCLFFNYLLLDPNDEANIYPTVDDAENETNSLIPGPMKAQNGSLTVITGMGDVVVTLKGNNATFIRNFEVFFSYECISPVPPDVLFLHSPVYAKNVKDEPKRDCLFNFNLIAHSRDVPVFTFEEYSMGNSKVTIEESNPPIGTYNKDQPTDFFIKDKVMSLKVIPKFNSTDRFLLKIHHVDQRCSFYQEIGDGNPVALKSPHEELDDGSNAVECRWLVKHTSPDIFLGLKLDILEFNSVFDMVAVNDGLSEVSSPLLQVTTSNRNYSRNQLIRSGGPYIWISFRPLTYVSNFNASVTVHGQGGHLINSGTFSMHPTTGDDTAFQLEVEDGKVVQLTFDDFSITPPATVSIYDGFDKSHPLMTLHERANFPIFSISSRMMVLATNFSAETNKFSAKFKGVSPGCDHMNYLSAESYILSENCNSSCNWIIPTANTSDSELIIDLQYIYLKEGDQMDIRLLDKNLTTLAHVTSETKHLPHFAVPISVGATITVTQAACKVNKTDKVILIGHSSVMPDCKHAVTLKASEKMQISSPLYPDTYPIFSTCQWNFTLPKDSLVHMAFQDFDLAENHCVKISENQTLKHEYSGKVLPDDVLLNENFVVEFDSSDCNKKQVGLSLKSDPGFVLNVTVADCGGILDATKSVFNTSISDNKTSTCIWKVNVTENNAVNVITYTVTKKDELKNYELTVYDGSSVRDSKIVNNTNLNIWSRSSVLIFVYKRLDVSQNSSVLVINYNTITCNSSMLCENKICMHPDWRCNGVNDCGDFTDEKNCKSVPVPPEIRFTGYTGTAFWMCIFAMLILGIICGLGIPVCYQKYKNSRYTRFRELNGIDS